MSKHARFNGEIPRRRGPFGAWTVVLPFLWVAIAPAQDATDAAWSRIGGTVVASGLASPTTGPVNKVWFASNGRRLLAETAAGRIFETSDASHWRLNNADPAPESGRAALGVVVPENGATVVAAGTRLYAAGHSNVYASDDNGRTWLNVTGFNNRSVVGDSFTGLAVSPDNPLEVVAANRFGVWRSLDGGLSWRGLNDDLPNLAVRKLTGARSVVLADGMSAAVESGTWALSNSPDPELILRARLIAQARRGFATATQSGAQIYGGGLDGRIAVSRDNGVTWTESSTAATGPITKIWVDSTRTDSALAISGSKLLRTTNGGAFWDDVTGSLPQAAIHGVTADRSAGVVYVATDRGVFAGKLALDSAGPVASDWRSVSRNLPAAPAWDVRLNTDNTLTVAIDGYGVFEAPAPHRTRAIRLLNGADMTERAAAPGSLVGIQGANVQRATVGTRDWPVVGSSDRSSQFQVPFESPAGVYQISLEGPGGRWTAPLAVKNASPAIFVDSDGAPLLLDGASGLVLDPSAAVHASSTVQLLATGLGQVTPEWPTGVPAPYDAPPTVRGAVTAYLDGLPVEVTRATLAPGYVGYYVVELRIPAIVNRGVSELRLLMNGEESNRVRLYLESELASK